MNGRRKENAMKGRTIFFADIDGTLVGDDFLLGEEVIRAVKEYERSAGQLVLCTGRSVYGTRDIAGKLEISVPAILYNGAVIYDFQKKEILWKRPLNRAVMKDIRRVYDNFPEVCVQIFTEKDIYRIRTNWMVENRGVPEERGTLYSEIPDIREDILKITLIADHAGELAGCRKYFAEADCSFEFSGRHFVEIVRRDCGKQLAAKELLGYLRIHQDCIFAAGNGHNDIELLRQSDYAFVPVTAEEEVRRFADCLIEGPKEQGMARAFGAASIYKAL